MTLIRFGAGAGAVLADIGVEAGAVGVMLPLPHCAAVFDGD